MMLGFELGLPDREKREYLSKIFEAAIRKWLKISIKRDFFSYGGGVSGANIYSVPFSLSFPGITHDPLDLRIVIKLASKKSFELEKEKYEELKKIKRLSEYFVSLSSSPAHVNEEFFMVMEFLEGYDSLETVLYSIRKELAYERCMMALDAIQDIQFGEGGKTKASEVGILCSMYFGEIEESVSTILERNKRLGKMVFESPLSTCEEDNACRKLSLLDCIQKLWSKRKKMEPTFNVRMHGDCHPRNILLNLSSSQRVKFIDIDRFTSKGDYIYDFGELLADLEVLGYVLGEIHFSLPSNPVEYNLELPEAVRSAIPIIQKKVREVAEQDGSNWMARLYLAKARYLLSMVPRFKPVYFSRAFVAFCEGLKAMQNAVDALQES